MYRFLPLGANYRRIMRREGHDGRRLVRVLSRLHLKYGVTLDWTLDGILGSIPNRILLDW